MSNVKQIKAITVRIVAIEVGWGFQHNKDISGL